jgi:hypothetical protein
MTRGSTLLALSMAVVIGLPTTALGQAPAPAKPGPEHQRLNYFVGKWTVVGEAQASPMSPAGKFTSTDTCEWFDGRFAVVCRSVGKTPAGPMKSIGIMSYSADQKLYTYYGTDSSGMTMTSVPRGTVQGDTWTYDDEGVFAGQKMKIRVTLKELSPTSYTFKMEIQGPDGKWAPIMESKSTKVK